MATKVIEADFEVTTPLFSSGADPGGSGGPELRPPSLKGILRFWWRALAWSRLEGRLREIKREEDSLFGSTETGQSRVILDVTQEERPRVVRHREVLKHASGGVVGEGARYLGYGVMEAFGSGKKGTEAGELTRPCLRAPFPFALQLRCRNLDGAQLSMLQDALRAMGLLGGLGAKSRKGYGSLALRRLRVDGKEIWQGPRDKDGLVSEIGRLLGAYKRDDLPKYTALSSWTRSVVVNSRQATEPLKMLDLVGREMMRYRSWGHNGRVLGGPSERNFQPDHDLMKQHRRRTHPRRIAFGLPHNYGKQKDQQVGPADPSLDRRASPLFIHIHSLGDKGREPYAVLTLVPAEFLPQRARDISVGGKPVSLESEEVLYQPVEQFLHRLTDPTDRKEPFGTATEVRP